MLLHVQDLSIRLKTNPQHPPLVSKVSFSLDHNKCLGIVGESGSGKSLTCYAINGLLADCFSVEGSIRFNGEDLLAQSERVRQGIREVQAEGRLGGKPTIIVSGRSTAKPRPGNSSHRLRSARLSLLQR